MTGRALGALAAAAALLGCFAAAAQDRGASVPGDLSIVTVDGRNVPLGGGVTHLVLAARWCAPCETEVRALRRGMAMARRDAYRVAVVGVARRQSSAEFADWARALGYDGALAFDADGRLEEALGAAMLPWHVVIGPDRHILWSSDRAPRPEAVRSWVARRP